MTAKDVAEHPDLPARHQRTLRRVPLRAGGPAAALLLGRDSGRTAGVVSPGGHVGWRGRLPPCLGLREESCGHLLQHRAGPAAALPELPQADPLPFRPDVPP